MSKMECSVLSTVLTERNSNPLMISVLNIFNQEI
jgi:hypothetical protein